MIPDTRTQPLSFGILTGIILSAILFCPRAGALYGGRYFLSSLWSVILIVDPKHGLHRNQILAGVREPEMGVQESMIGSTPLKDPKYRPEREVRIVAIPGTGKLNAIAMREYPHVFKPLPLPQIRAREGGRRYVSRI